ncbi:hypothetical protein [Williamwhitmania taraxaci]|uniref:Uncharacterized protein n=1 Tax=Williamwhitmania taraxaci TaxID=1640674 RepID=A0A1G6L7X0_9BACT|nr:hypothetical protein [Williamwhitmania taraxaci]SDC39344.1 hypothetical protein SAMN05216323_102934 [Williamwhitmania taraxaci]
MSTSRNNIRLKQASYQIRGEVISTLAEAGSLCLYSYIIPTQPSSISFGGAFVFTNKHTVRTTVCCYGKAHNTYRLECASDILCDPFSLPLKRTDLPYERPN